MIINKQKKNEMVKEEANKVVNANEDNKWV
jgi:hypothetical protein